MKISDDHSLFAWRDTSDQTSKDNSHFERRHLPSKELQRRGLLAKSPAEFIHSRNIVPLPSNHTSTAYSMTNQGLRIELVLQPWVGGNIYSAVLDCMDIMQHRGPLGIHLKCLSPPNGDQFARVFPNELHPIVIMCGNCMADRLPARTLYVKENHHVTQYRNSDIDHAYLFSISKIPSGTGYHQAAVYPPRRWNPVDGILNLPSKSIGVAGVLLFEGLSGPFMVVIAVNCNFCISTRIEVGNDLKMAYEHNAFLLENDIRRRPKIGALSVVLEREYVADYPTNINALSFTARPRERVGDYWVVVGVESSQIEAKTMAGPCSVFTVYVTIDTKTPA